MGKRRLQRRTVPHNGIGQICKILLPKKGQRYFAEFFRQRNTSHAAFHISRQISGIILKIGSGEDKREADQIARRIKRRSAAGYASVHKIDDKLI